MIKNLDWYLSTSFINRKFIVKVRPFSAAKTLGQQDYNKHTKRDFDPFLCMIYISTNNLLLEDTLKII